MLTVVGLLILSPVCRCFFLSATFAPRAPPRQQQSASSHTAEAMSAKPGDAKKGKAGPAGGKATSPPSISPAAPAGAPASSVAFSPALPPASALQPGASLRVTTALGASFDAVLHCYDPAADILVVEIVYAFDDPLAYHDRPASSAQAQAAEAAVKGEGKKDYSLLSGKQVRSVQTSNRSCTTCDVSNCRAHAVFTSLFHLVASK